MSLLVDFVANICPLQGKDILNNKYLLDIILLALLIDVVASIIDFKLVFVRKVNTNMFKIHQKQWNSLSVLSRLSIDFGNGITYWDYCTSIVFQSCKTVWSFVKLLWNWPVFYRPRCNTHSGSKITKKSFSTNNLHNSYSGIPN